MWYYAVGNQKGQAELEKLVQFIQSGQLGPDTLVWTEGMANWTKLANTDLAKHLPVKSVNVPPGQVPPPPPKQLFCTNCGKGISEQAVACMACGAKPLGHKKFCRWCGVALNAEQVVCTQCGSNVAATMMPDAKRVVQSVISSSAPTIEKIKKNKNLLLKSFFAVVISIVVVGGLVYTLSAVISLVGGATSSGGGGTSSGANDPSAVVRNFDAALRKWDTEAIGKLVTTDISEKLVRIGAGTGSETIKDALKMNGKIVDCRHIIKGNNNDAIVYITYENNKKGDEYSLTKIDGKWRIDGDGDNKKSILSPYR